MNIKHNKVRMQRSKIPVSLGLKTSFLGLVVFLMCFTFVPYLISDANAETANLNVDWLPITLELDTGSNNSSDGNVDFGNVTPRSSSASGFYGTLATNKKVLEVNTTAKYFKVFLSMASDATTQNLCYVNPSNNDELLCDTTSTAGIVPIQNATPSNPKAFTGTSWGFAIGDGNVEPSNGSATGNDFSSADSYKVLSGGVELNNAITDDVNASVYTAKFASVPLYGNEVPIWSASTSNTSGFGGENGDSNNTKSIYYGVMVGTDLVSGKYKNKILYTAVASASSLDSVSSNMVVNTINASNATYGNIGGPTDLVRLDMDLATDATISANDVTVKVYKHSDINSSTKEANSGATAVGDCNIKSVTADTSNGNLVVKCEMPGIDSNNSSFGQTSLEGVGVDFIVTVNPLENQTVKYSSYSGSTGKFIYAGLQTRIGAANDSTSTAHYVQNMQQMSAGICKMTNMFPNQVQHIGGTGSGYTGGNLNASVAVNKRWTDSDEGSYKLADSRDGKAYLIRRLADGNCWMVQNLDLELYADVQLSSSNTDLGYDIDLPIKT